LPSLTQKAPRLAGAAGQSAGERQQGQGQGQSQPRGRSGRGAQAAATAAAADAPAAVWQRIGVDITA
jgi:hypothetical protein